MGSGKEGEGTPSRVMFRSRRQRHVSPALVMRGRRVGRETKGAPGSPFPVEKAPVAEKSVPTYRGLCEDDTELQRWIKERDALSKKIQQRRQKHRRGAGKSS